LADLTKRENRFSHDRRDFHTTGPLVGQFTGHPLQYDASIPNDPNDPNDSLKPFPSGSDREGDDVVLTRVLAFDVRVFDPGAPLLTFGAGTPIVSPGDPGWDPTDGNANIQAVGAYVDLNYANDASISVFSGPPAAKSGLVGVGRGTYCTWSFHYEHDGINQDGDTQLPSPDELVDEGTDGRDFDVDLATNTVVNQHGVDDPGERETSPPYPVPLRGLQVRIRVYEPDSQTVRQSTVTRTFVQ
jgi:hypothetical protein